MSPIIQWWYHYPRDLRPIFRVLRKRVKLSRFSNNVTYELVITDNIRHNNNRYKFDNTLKVSIPPNYKGFSPDKIRTNTVIQIMGYETKMDIRNNIYITCPSVRTASSFSGQHTQYKTVACWFDSIHDVSTTKNPNGVRDSEELFGFGSDDTVNTPMPTD